MSLLASAQSGSPSSRIRELEQLVAKQQEQIERMRKAKLVLPSKKQTKAKGKAFTRVFIPDTHGAHIDEQAAAALLADLEILNPTEVIYLGDHIDCGGFLAQHHVLGTVPETEVSFEDDVTAANTFLDEVEKRTPNATKQFIEGNHEARIEKFIIKACLGNPRNSKYWRQSFGPEIVLSLAERKIRFIKRTEQYDGMSIRGTIDLGHCLARHGKRAGAMAAHRTVAQFGCNIAFAHCHRVLTASKETHKGIAYAWCFGCLCKLQPLWMDTDPTDWAHAYGVQFGTVDGGFLTIQVPIIAGRSFLSAMAEQIQF